jgi:hypothetical protein
MRRWEAVAAVAVCTVSQAACGLMLQGKFQAVQVTTAPSAATASAPGASTITPGTVTVRRRSSGPLFIRIQKQGFYSTCRFLRWEKDKGLIALDSIPLAIPLLIDLSFGAMPGAFQDVYVDLDKIPPGYADIVQTDEQLLVAWANRIDMCNLSPETAEWMRLKSRFGEQAKSVIAVPGDMSKGYEILGQVDAHAKGTNWWALNAWAFGGAAGFNFKHVTNKESHAAMNEILKLKAIAQYGDRVNAVVNVQYEDLPGYDVSATGLAVQFTDRSGGTSSRSASARLRQLDQLLREGAITHAEYEQKRAEVLRGL